MNTMKILTLFVVTGILAIGTSCTPKKEKTAEAEKIDIRQSVPVKTMIARQEPITRTIDFTATLIPFEEVHLAPSAPGRIEKINVEIGDRVSKDQVVELPDLIVMMLRLPKNLSNP